VSLFISI